MPNYRIRWKVSSDTTNTWINASGSTGIYLPGTAVTVTDIAKAGDNVTLTVTTGTTNHQFAKGQSVILSGVSPSAYNGAYEVTATGTSGSNYTFTCVAPATISSAYTSGGTATPTQGVTSTISTVSGSGTSATVTTTTAHGFKVGEPVRITGTSVTGYNKSATIETVPSTTTFTYASSTTGSSSGGNAISQGIYTIRTAYCASGKSITSGTQYDVEVAYDTGGTISWPGATTAATPIASSDTLPTGTTSTAITSGTNYTATSGIGTATRCSFTNGGSTIGYGIIVDFGQSANSWTRVDVTVTYLGVTYALSKVRSGNMGTIYFPVPLAAKAVVKVTANAAAGNGTTTILPYVA